VKLPLFNFGWRFTCIYTKSNEYSLCVFQVILSLSYVGNPITLHNNRDMQSGMCTLSLYCNCKRTKHQLSYDDSAFRPFLMFAKTYFQFTSIPKQITSFHSVAPSVLIFSFRELNICPYRVQLVQLKQMDSNWCDVIGSPRSAVSNFENRNIAILRPNHHQL
jgi:hypothetical protein